jgi:uncharacterized protein YidB (DUF937 family)
VARRHRPGCAKPGRSAGIPHRGGDRVHDAPNLGRILGGVGPAGVGGLLASALSELVEHFTKGGHGAAATSWVDQGPNREIAEAELERAISPATLDRLVEQTGLGRSEIVSRLSRELPTAVDRTATDGRRIV